MVHRLQAPVRRGQAVAFSPDGQRLASGGFFGDLRLWDTTTGRELAVLSGHTDHVVTVSFSPDGQRLATGSWDTTLKVWDVARRRELFTQRTSGKVQGVAFLPDGRTAVLAASRPEKGRRGVVELRDVQGTGQARALTPGPGNLHNVADVVFNADGTRLGVTGGATFWRELTSRVLDPTTGRLVFGPVPGDGLAFCADGRVAVGSQGGGLGIWDLASGQQVRVGEGSHDIFWGAAASPDGTLVAGACTDQVVRVWDVRTGRQVHELRGHTAQVAALAFRPDGRQLASGDVKMKVRLWDLADRGTGREATANGEIFALAYSPDGRHLAVGAGSWSVTVVDARSGEVVHTLRGHNRGVYGVAYSPDGRRLASASHDKTVRLWDTETGRQVFSLPGEGRMTAVAFSPDGHRLATGGEDANLKIWDATPLPADGSGPAP